MINCVYCPRIIYDSITVLPRPPEEPKQQLPTPPATEHEYSDSEEPGPDMVDPQILLQESTVNEPQESTSGSVSGPATDGSTRMSARPTRTIYDKIMQLPKDGKIAEKEGSTDNAIKQQRAIYKEIVVQFDKSKAKPTAKLSNNLQRGHSASGSDQGRIRQSHTEWARQKGRKIMSSKRVFMQKGDEFECNPDTTPIATGTRLYKSTTDDDNLMDDPKEYQSIVGSQT